MHNTHTQVYVHMCPHIAIKPNTHSPVSMVQPNLCKCTHCTHITQTYRHTDIVHTHTDVHIRNVHAYGTTIHKYTPTEYTPTQRTNSHIHRSACANTHVPSACTHTHTHTPCMYSYPVHTLRQSSRTHVYNRARTENTLTSPARAYLDGRSRTSVRKAELTTGPATLQPLGLMFQERKEKPDASGGKEKFS